MWQQAQFADVNGNGQIDLLDAVDWCSALAFSEALVLAGHDDWRLPNIRELQSIADYGRVAPACDPVLCEPPPRGFLYWSSTSYVRRSSLCILHESHRRQHLATAPKDTAVTVFAQSAPHRDRATRYPSGKADQRFHRADATPPRAACHMNEETPNPTPPGVPSATARFIGYLAAKHSVTVHAGHEGTTRELFSVEAVDAIVIHRPEACEACHAPLPALQAEGDPQPVRHQVWELREKPCSVTTSIKRMHAPASSAGT
jgi:hypothetical protein